MEKPKKGDYTYLFDRHHAGFNEYLHEIDKYEKHIASLRTFTASKELLSQMKEGDKIEEEDMVIRSRCCGRCDRVNDVCVADMICSVHNVTGCEICFGSKEVAYPRVKEVKEDDIWIEAADKLRTDPLTSGRVNLTPARVLAVIQKHYTLTRKK